MSTRRKNIEARINAWERFESKRSAILEQIEHKNRMVRKVLEAGGGDRECVQHAVLSFFEAMKAYAQALKFALKAFPRDRRGTTAERIILYSEVLAVLNRFAEALHGALTNLFLLQNSGQYVDDDDLERYACIVFGPKEQRGELDLKSFLDELTVFLFKLNWELRVEHGEEFLYRYAVIQEAMNENSEQMAARARAWGRFVVSGGREKRIMKLLEGQCMSHVYLAKFLEPKLQNGLRLSSVDELWGFIFWFYFTSYTRKCLSDKLDALNVDQKEWVEYYKAAIA